jgi:2-polyprenyl-6-methoxyphenol hydroxylase-like FAD-dependent oxidoreductase
VADAIAVGMRRSGGRWLLRPDASAASEVLTPDLVVAADGIDSPTRAALFPGHPSPVYTGVTAWRSVAPAPPGLRQGGCRALEDAVGRFAAPMLVRRMEPIVGWKPPVSGPS